MCYAVYAYHRFVFMELYQTAITGVTLKFPEGVVAVNLPEKKGNTPIPDVVLCTYPVFVDGWSESAAQSADEQRVFFGPGEYEKSGLHLYGVGTETAVGGRTVQTTSWLVDDGNMRCLILGDVADRGGVQNAISFFGDVDVLVCFCLSGSEEKRLDAAGVAALGVALQVRRVVLVGDNEAMKKRVVKEFGDSEESVGKYVLKKKDLQEDVAKTVLFV